MHETLKKHSKRLLEFSRKLQQERRNNAVMTMKDERQ